MHPPPSTPTPRRFLLPKRSTQGSSSQTPAPAAATPRFQSTPRFSGVTSSAARPIGRRAVSHEIEDVDEAELSSQGNEIDEEEERVVSSSIGDEPLIDARGDLTERDEILDVEASSWQNGQEEADEVVIGSESPEQRRVKRRRISLSEAVTSSPTHLTQRSLPPASPSGGGFHSQQSDDHKDGDDDSRWSNSDEGHAYAEEADSTTRGVAQPTFRAAPRFKPTEAEILVEDGLTGVFSPQRRGVKYVPGGLAGELQGWLSDVKRWDEDLNTSARRGREKFVVRVGEVRPGGRMYLVQGRVQRDRGESEEGRFVLAGEGRMTGLGTRMEVGKGSLVEIEGPAWEVELLGDMWTVAVEWSVL